jgi:hypothetical protein
VLQSEHSSAEEKKASEAWLQPLRWRVRQRRFSSEKPPLAEGTLGAVVRVIFREKARKTALQGASGESQMLLAGSFARGPTPQGRRAQLFPSSVRHDFAEVHGNPQQIVVICLKDTPRRLGKGWARLVGSALLRSSRKAGPRRQYSPVPLAAFARRQ